MLIATLKKSTEYKYLTTHGTRYAGKGFVVLGCVSPTGDASTIRYGVVASRKLGNAVRRNRVKRRFRALCQAILPVDGTPGWDYVLIGRYNAHDMEFTRLAEELKRALKHVAKAAQ